MKLNDFKLIENTLTEAQRDASYYVGDIGKAMMQQANARFNPFSKKGNPELSTQDRMTSNIYVKDFVGRAKEALQRGIEGQQIDPNPNALGPAPAPKPGPTPTPGPTPEPKPGPTPAPTPGPTLTPGPTPGGAKQPIGKSPEELARIRKEKQKLAGAEIQKQMAANPVPVKSTQPVKPTAPTPSQVRQQKQAVAAKNAQAQMAPMSKLPADQFAKSAANVRQQKQAAATAALQTQMQPKQQTAPTVWKNNRTGKVGTSPVVKESIFEAGQYPDTIRSFINKFFKKYNTGLAMSPEIMKQVDAIATQAQANYKKTGAQAELDQLAKLGYSINQSELANQPVQDKEAGKEIEKPMGAKQPMGTTGYDRQSGDLLGHGSKDGTTADQLNKGAPTSDVSAVSGDEKSGTTTPPTTTTTPVKPETAYNQAKKLLSKLNKQQKKFVLNALKKELGMPVDKKASAEPATEPSAMSNMARQLSAMGQKQTSTGGTQVPTGTGVRHTAGVGQSINQAKALANKIPAPKTKAPKTKKSKEVAENKTYKIWGAL